MLLSNRRADKSRARFRLMHTVRTHLGQVDECYKAVFQQEDDEGGPISPPYLPCISPVSPLGLPAGGRRG